MIAGWGATSSENGASVEHLRWGQVELVGRNVCERLYEKWGRVQQKVIIGPDLFCAGGEKVDACAGEILILICKNINFIIQGTVEHL